MKKIIIAIPFIVILCVSGLSIWKHGWKDFFDINIANVLTLSTAIIFTFLLTQKKNEDHRFRDSIVRLLENLQTRINDNLINSGFNEESMLKLQQEMRTIRNAIYAFRSVKNKLNIATEIDYIESQFNTYKDVIDNHICNYVYLEESSIDLSNYVALMSSKITETIVKIYTPE